MSKQRLYRIRNGYTLHDLKRPAEQRALLHAKFVVHDSHAIEGQMHKLEVAHPNDLAAAIARAEDVTRKGKVVLSRNAVIERLVVGGSVTPGDYEAWPTEVDPSAEERAERAAYEAKCADALRHSGETLKSAKAELARIDEVHAGARKQHELDKTEPSAEERAEETEARELAEGIVAELTAAHDALAAAGGDIDKVTQPEPGGTS